jgi:hypothetical protein
MVYLSKQYAHAAPHNHCSNRCRKSNSPVRYVRTIICSNTQKFLKKSSGKTGGFMFNLNDFVMKKC